MSVKETPLDNREADLPKTATSLSDATTAISPASDPPPLKSLFTTHWEAPPPAEEEEMQSYRRLSVLAILSVICGIASFLGFMSIPCLFFAVLGILLAVWAYFGIVFSGKTLTGESLALFGLACSLIAFFSVSSMWYYYQYTVRVEADRFFSNICFQAIKDKNTRLYFECTKPSWSRRLNVPEEEWWKENLTPPKSEMGPEMDMGMGMNPVEMFKSQLNNPVFKTLWVLGEKADVSYYKTIRNYYHDGTDNITILYAVTFPNEQGDKETFFLEVQGTRTANPKDPYQMGWALKNTPTLAKELEEVGSRE